MKKYIKAFVILVILIIFYLYIANITLMPKSITLLQGEKLELAKMWGINLTSNSSNSKFETLETSSNNGQNSLSNVGRINLNVNVFKQLNLSKIIVNVIPNTKVVPLGNTIGLKLYTEGVLVVGVSEIGGEKPYEKSGLKEGDRIISINNKKINNTNDLIETVSNSNGEGIKIDYIDNQNNQETTSIVPAKTEENEYKLGLWVRDAAAGVGTATFYEPNSNTFAALGHGITDIDTGELITIANGELVNSNILSIIKGKKGVPGEIRGSIEGQTKLGDITENTRFGVFGKISNEAKLELNDSEIEVLQRSEVKQGKAQIICELENGKKEYYDIVIERINLSNNKDNKSMLIKVTDERLIEKTGGIIQGMSGSPIIQDGKFVGAITHVLVNDPTQGYGIFADMMLKQLTQ